MIFRVLPLFLALVSCANPAVAVRSQNSCETGYVEWQDRSLSELVEESHTIFLASVTSFTPDTSVEGFDGYYILASTGTELKGGAQSQIRIYGNLPYTYPPQIYFDIPGRHQEIADRHREFGQISLPGGIAGVTQIGTHCPLAPRFVIGYRYLVMLGTESPLSFEPVHSARNDAWFLAVRGAVEAE